MGSTVKKKTLVGNHLQVRFLDKTDAISQWVPIKKNIYI